MTSDKDDKEMARITENVKTIARSLMTLNPITTPIAQIWGEMDSRKESERLGLFTKSLEALISRHSNELDKIKEELKSGKTNQDEFSKRLDAFEITLEQVPKEHDMKKVHLYANMGCNSIIIPEQVLPYRQKVNAIEMFSELSVDDLSILYLFCNNATYQVCELNGFSLDILIPALSKLGARGLIAETVPSNRSILMMPGTQRWDDVWSHKYFVILTAGKNLLKMLEK
jgi:hypothetical protein